MTDVSINPCFWIAARFGVDEQSKCYVLYPLILRIMSPEFSSGLLDFGLIKR